VRSWVIVSVLALLFLSQGGYSGSAKAKNGFCGWVLCSSSRMIFSNDAEER